jgi:Kdo2-lipid IVA lauroyltransferase/acyltransferase
MLYPILYYLVLVPLSSLPYIFIKCISSGFYYLLYYVFSYRKKIVLQNLRNAFPEKSEKQLRALCRMFYKHLCDTVFEGLMCFTITRENLMNHIRCSNPEVINAYFEKGQSVIIAIGHYGSWEFFLTGMNALIKHQVVIIYTPLTNPFMEKKMMRARESFGTRMISKSEVKSFFEEKPSQPTATLFAIDQWPAKAKKPYWMRFLNQETAVAFGTEKYAKDSDQAVLYATIRREKRGRYELSFTPVCDEPKNTAYGFITESITGLLEKDIQKEPAYWLWSHRRWKQTKAEVEAEKD